MTFFTAFLSLAETAASRMALGSGYLMPIRAMSKYLSKAGKTRLVLTTKRARKGFYKGKGSTKEGHLTSKGRFIVNHRRRLQLILPDLTGFKLKPYIARGVPRFPPEQRRTPVSV